MEPVRSLYGFRGNAGCSLRIGSSAATDHNLNALVPAGPFGDRTRRTPGDDVHWSPGLEVTRQRTVGSTLPDHRVVNADEPGRFHYKRERSTVRRSVLEPVRIPSEKARAALNVLLSSDTSDLSTTAPLWVR